MESLSNETWDVVIAGTSLPQSLLALALSKCDVKVLHVDKNDYYGGLDAGLSLLEAEKWIQNKQEPEDPVQFSIKKPTTSTASLGPSRAYTIALKPQIIYARSRFLPTLVSSQIHSQLEFQAVGSFWVCAGGKFQKIPSNREDVFADDTISVRDKRRLMGLLRYVLEEQDEAAESSSSTLAAKLQDQFKLPHNLQPPVQALTLSTDTLSNVDFDVAIARLKQHLASMGYFGPGLAAVMAKYGGNAEIAQVACRAGAVGGFVYLLGQGIDTVDAHAEDTSLMSVKLADGTAVKTRHIVGASADLPNARGTLLSTSSTDSKLKVAYQISIISGSLRHLFIATSENGPVPAATIVLVDDGSQDKPPVYLQVHSEDTGECPNGQYIVYASCIDSDTSTTKARIEKAVADLVSTSSTETSAEVLWSMYYVQNESATSHISQPPLEQDASGKVLVFPQRTYDIAFDDTILDSVKAAWEKILGDRSAEYDFLRFEERKDEDNEGS